MNSTKIKNFRDLKIWQRGVQLVEDIYQNTKTFPKEEVYGLTGQLRRAAVSIPSNIAEGFGRFHNKEYAQFLFTALGSCSEVITQLTIAQRLGFIKNNNAESLIGEAEQISKMIMGLVKKLRENTIH
ncbi:MAG: four helix bundle protein [Phycisphaerae bacterium]|nr:four helix bundle protein [Phycisphaerae bacterium]MDD5380578.1 four helix bundle protein [Phycisphaerae bacterium]